MEGYDPPITRGDLSSAYSGLNDPEDVKRFRKYYTPATVVSYMLRQLGYPEAPGGPLLDPACGTRAFLVEAARRYLAGNPKAEWDDLTHEVRDIDTDPVAILIARVRVLEVALDTGLEVGKAPLRIDCRDALALKSGQSGTLFEDFGERREELAGYVVGNPPYGKVHSSNPRVRPFKHTIQGHANLYGIFLALAVGMLGEGVE
jgi:adenine-specific DNA-methyltransferase